MSFNFSNPDFFSDETEKELIFGSACFTNPTPSKVRVEPSCPKRPLDRDDFLGPLEKYVNANKIKLFKLEVCPLVDGFITSKFVLENKIKYSIDQECRCCKEGLCSNFVPTFVNPNFEKKKCLACFEIGTCKKNFCNYLEKRVKTTPEGVLITFEDHVGGYGQYDFEYFDRFNNFIKSESIWIDSNEESDDESENDYDSSQSCQQESSSETSSKSSSYCSFM